MGTSYHITLVDVPATLEKTGLQQEIDAELVRVNQEMSTYIDDSELMRFNRGPVGEAVPVSAPLADVVALSLDIYQRSSGAFDITVGPLVNLWGFGPQPEPDQIPTAVEIETLLAQIGSDALTVERNPDRITRSRPVEIDLSAIAKGHGVDRVALLLEARGARNYLVEIGGELRSRGKNPQGLDWRIGIESPDPSGRVVQRPIAISGKSVATSGDYRNYYERDGVRYAHSIDPRTGRPLQHRLASVTVIADDCAEADGLATALNVLGAEAGLQLAERENLAVFMLVKTDKGFEERYSSAFAPYLEKSES
ncbi:FAD:protein FMN transferase [Microbulbifer thermotolerans]|uniref:FAD:protein FMN transferase n=1 Tax=Microbulbifer thermotolerans TaxID=252514 RepID=UPI00224B21FB|nr:FAD:protein FMN transferase [Microbulbifer thermotolerans]MCX2833550.1 FAD:protein FMN transferase [Microbulbifer thermotolerans]